MAVARKRGNLIACCPFRTLCQVGIGLPGSHATFSHRFHGCLELSLRSYRFQWTEVFAGKVLHDLEAHPLLVGHIPNNNRHALEACLLCSAQPALAVTQAAVRRNTDRLKHTVLSNGL